MWMQTKQAWSQLAQRERNLLKLLGGVLMVSLFYFGLWSPMHSAHDNAKQFQQRAQQNWQWLNEQVLANPRVVGSQNAFRFSSQSQLMSTLQSTLRNENLHLSMQAMTPTTDSIKVDFKAVDAPKFFGWLSLLEQQGLVSNQLQVSVVKTGVIEASVRFGVVK